MTNSRAIIVIVALGGISILLVWRARGLEGARGSAIPFPSERDVASSLAESDSREQFSLKESRTQREEEASDSGLKAIPAIQQGVGVEPSNQEGYDPAEGSAASLMEMNEDPAFFQACANPAEVQTETLKELIEKATNVFNAFLREECYRRVEAGIFQRVEGYTPGQPFTMESGHGKELQSYYLKDGEAVRVNFYVTEYPYLYSLRDSMDLLRQEIMKRAGSNSR